MPWPAETFPDLPFHSMCTQSPGLEKLYLTECSSLPEHLFSFLKSQSLSLQLKNIIKLYRQCPVQPSLLHTWEDLQPNCNQIHTVTKIKKKTSRQKAILYSSPGPDQGLSPAWEPLFLCPLPISLGPIVSPWGPSSVLSSSAVSSMGCQRLRTWYRGLPLVHPQLCGSVASHSQMPTEG